MREIKFRAWDKKLNMMVYGKEQTGHVEYGTNPLDAVNYLLNYDDYGYIFMQYTGQKDKNGKEIYEGDILITIDEEEGIIVWDESKFDYRIDTGIVLLKLGGYYSSEIEVIGNIYDNPELV